MPNRREFLTAMTATTGTLLVAAGPAALVEARRPSVTGLPPGETYVEGTVAAIAPGLIQVRNRWQPKASPIAVRITPSTDICKGACGQPLDRVHVGDRVDAWVVDLPDGTRAARWVNVNVVGFMGDVVEVRASELLVRRMSSGRTYRVAIIPETRIQLDNKIVPPSTSYFHVADDVHVGGAAPDPILPPTVVLATLIVATSP